MFKRGKIWYFSIDGVKESSGTTDKKRAEALERKRKQEAWDKANGYYVKTWDEACLSWLEPNRVLASYPQNKIFATFWTAHLTGLKLNAITKELVHSLVMSPRSKGLFHRSPSLSERIKANATANNYVRFVQKIIRSGSNLDPEFQIYPEPNEARRWLRTQEWIELEGTMRREEFTDLRHISTFALATGLRAKNDMRFSWSWLHGNSAYLPRQVTKTAEDYGIPLNSVAQGIIRERRQEKVSHPHLVFTQAGQPWTVHHLLGNDNGTTPGSLYRAVKLAGIDRMTFHTFRHTFASWLAQRGVSDTIRKRLGCWSQGGDAASGYVHFDVESLRPFSEMVFPSECMSDSGSVEAKGKSA